MATYKVIQDVEAEDKLIGPLSLRQFIYAAITVVLLYISFIMITKGFAFMLLFFVPPALLTGFLAAPWRGDQPTEVWAIAKIRFLLKPRKRIWDQTGAKELVTITAPKAVQRTYTNNLTQEEVRHRLYALANTVDSRGWAVKNVNLNMTDANSYYQPSDRLVDASTFPQEVSNLDVRASDDILDTTANPVAQHFDSLMTTAAANQRQHLIDQMNQPAQAAPIATAPTPQAQQAPADYWFMHQPAPAPIPGQATFQSSTVVSPGTTPEQTQPVQQMPVAAPAVDEATLAAQLKANTQQAVATDHMKRIKTPEEIAEDERQAAIAAARKAAEEAQKAQVTSEKRAAIMNLASNDDLDVATIARQANKKPQSDDGEVVISLR